VSAAYGFGTNCDVKGAIDFVQLVGAAGAEVRRIGDEPKLASPGNDCADAAFAVLVEGGEVGIDAGDLERLGGGGMGNKEDEKREEEMEMFHEGFRCRD
jgi:hypothetical protein